METRLRIFNLGLPTFVSPGASTMLRTRGEVAERFESGGLENR